MGLFSGFDNFLSNLSQQAGNPATGLAGRLQQDIQPLVSLGQGLGGLVAGGQQQLPPIATAPTMQAPTPPGTFMPPPNIPTPDQSPGASIPGPVGQMPPQPAQQGGTPSLAASASTPIPAPPAALMAQPQAPPATALGTALKALSGAPKAQIPAIAPLSILNAQPPQVPQFGGPGGVAPTPAGPVGQTPSFLAHHVSITQRPQLFRPLQPTNGS